MAGNWVVALDLGTSAVHCLVARLDGTPAHQGQAPHRHVMPPDASELAREFSPGGLWRMVAGLTKSTVAGAGLSGGDIAAVGVTGQRQAMALLDNRRREVYLGPNIDLRSVFQGAAIDEAHAREVYRTTGHLPSFFFAPAKVEWFRQQRPQAFRSISQVCTLPAWLAYRLTGDLLDEPTLLGEAGLLDVRRRQPAEALLRRLDLDSSWVPPLALVGAPVGEVSQAAAKATGLRPGTPVTLAGPDTQAALLGMGAIEPGQAGIVAGWSAPVQQVTARPLFDSRRRTWVGCHGLPERWVVEANPGDTGNAYAWLKRIVAPEEAYADLEREAIQAPPGSEGVTAFVGPRPVDLSRPGMTLGGLLMPVPLTYHQPLRGHLARAALENIAYAIRACLERAEGVARQPATSIHLGGGMSQSDLFTRILAAVLNRPVARYGREVSAVGAALAAATAAGQWPGLREAALEAECRHASIQPDALQAAEYEDHYQRWRDLLRRLEGMAGGLG